MNKEEIFEKLANVELYFQDYYKYTFYFVGTTSDGERLDVEAGGDGGDIYRVNVSSETPILFKDLPREFCDFDFVVTNSKGERLYEGTYP